MRICPPIPHSFNIQYGSYLHVLHVFESLTTTCIDLQNTSLFVSCVCIVSWIFAYITDWSANRTRQAQDINFLSKPVRTSCWGMNTALERSSQFAASPTKVLYCMLHKLLSLLWSDILSLCLEVNTSTSFTFETAHTVKVTLRQWMCSH